MFPDLFKLPFTNFTLNSYGLLLAIAFITGLFVMSRLAKRDGLPQERVYDLGLWVLASSLIGSKLLMIITEWDVYYRDHPGQIFSLDFFRSGGVFYGGFIAAIIASVVAMRLYKLPWWRTADAFAPGIAIGQAIGRLGCYSAGCCWGVPTTSALGVQFKERGHEITGVPTIVAHLTDPVQRELWSNKLGGLLAPLKLHPVQLYETGATFVIFLVLLAVTGRRRFHGQVMLAYAMLYAVVRFTIEHWRDDPRGEVWNLSTSQFIAIILFVASLIAYIWRVRKVTTTELAENAV
ncbi:MAG: prolipoprotein diacylglyceryl transferase [Acidobacteria bacterium]|nr:prolipoprotein diacylglyceryl transferase [Acidobacteriota bacterium]MBI3423223.1 prolipoprotein diacylglyceryl transferase [Acidobacteriota bacterium]